MYFLGSYVCATIRPNSLHILMLVWSASNKRISISNTTNAKTETSISKIVHVICQKKDVCRIVFMVSSLVVELLVTLPDVR